MTITLSLQAQIIALWTVFLFGITLFYTVMNFLHVALDLRVKPVEWYQIALVSVLFVVGLVLNVMAYQWMVQPVVV